MNNETAPILDILEELKQECKSIKKAQTELHIALVEQQNTKPQDDPKIPKLYISNYPKKRKPKSKSINFLFWRH